MMDKVVNLDVVVFTPGNKVGKFTVVDLTGRDITVACDCGSIRTYLLNHFGGTSGPRMCNDCVKKDMQKFTTVNVTTQNNKKYPPLDEDVSRSMIDKFIKEKKK